MSLYDFVRRDLNVIRGVTFAAVLRVVDVDDNPVSFDENTFYAAIHATDAVDGAVLATFLIEPLDAETGDIVIKLPQATTAGLTVSRFAGYFYCWYTGPSTGGERRPLWSGQVTVR